MNIIKQLQPKQWLLIIALLLPSFLIYSQGFYFDFIEIDDGGQLLENDIIQSLSWKNLVSIFSTATVAMYQPLTTLCFSLLTALFGHESAIPFKVFSYALHACNTYILYLICKKIAIHPYSAIIIAIIFSIHPLTVEPLAWISATSTLLFTLFYFLAWISYIYFLQTNKTKHQLLCLICFCCSCFSKVLALPFIGILFLTDYLFNKPLLNKGSIMIKLPFIFIGILFSFISLYFRSSQNAFPNYDYHPLFLVPNQLTWYIKKAIFPFNLGVLYDWPTFFSQGNLYVALFILGLLLFLFFKYKKNKLFRFGLLFYGCNIILHTSIFSVFLAPYADRYAYLSTVGLWVALGALFKKPTKAILVTSFGLILYFCYLSFYQLQHWQNTTTLWSRNLTHQKSTFANGMRGALYYQNKQYDLALADFELFIQDPDTRYEPEKHAYIYNALAFMSLNKNPEKSVKYATLALNFVQSPSYFQNLAIALKKSKKLNEAEEVYKTILKQYPTYVPAYYDLIALYFEEENFELIEPYLTTLINNNIDIYNNIKKRAFVYISIDNFEKASADIKQAKNILTKQGISLNQDMQLMQLIEFQNSSF